MDKLSQLAELGSEKTLLERERIDFQENMTLFLNNFISVFFQDTFRESLAFSRENKLLLSEKFLFLPTLLQKAVVAHEMAHVVQRWNAKEGSVLFGSDAELEVEAYAASAAVILGQTFECRLADSQPTKLRAWGVAGHYYTAYLMLLAAGIDNLTAYTMAFFAQMPDQVIELDATDAGLDIFFMVLVMKMAQLRACSETYLFRRVYIA